MLNLHNHTDFVADRFVLADREGRDCLLVVCKASFMIDERGQLHKTGKQYPLTLADHYIGAPERSCLEDTTDISLGKPGTDVAVIGYAYPQRPGAAISTIDLTVGSLKKEICVSGERHWKRIQHSYQATSPRPFERIPLRWEYAFGGCDEPRNPLGMHLHPDMPLPHFEHPKQRIQNLEARPTPICTGFIPPAWSPRTQFAGTYDETWMNNRMPLLPEDFDERFFHGVSTDQVVPGHLHGHEYVELKGVCWRSDLKFCLPALAFACQIKEMNHEYSLALHMDKLVVDSEQRRLTLLWSGVHPMVNPPQDIEQIVIFPTSIPT